MLAYAARRRRIAQRPSSPQAMLFIACAHIVLIAAVMSAKIDLPGRLLDPPIKIFPVPTEPEPPDPTTRAQPRHQLPPTVPAKTDVKIPPKPIADWPIEAQPSLGQDRGSDGALTGGSGSGTVTQPGPLPVATGPVMITPAWDLKPPYPVGKLAAGEEAVLSLRLTISESGRVVAVDPVGQADAAFLNAARRHLMARWRYKPAMQDGHAVTSTVVITLRFMLDD